MIELREIDEENFQAIVSMRLPEEQRRFVADNVYSLAQAWLYREAGDVFPCAVYAQGRPVGFMMAETDEEAREFILWRLVIAPSCQGRGYGTAAVKLAIEKARLSGKFDFATVDYKPGNEAARRAYEKAGFAATGERANGEEIVMRMTLTNRG